MGKSPQIAVDQDSGSDRITARVGTRTKKAKIVFDPSDHYLPRKRNRRGEGDVIVTGTPKVESIRTATPSSSSSSSIDGSSTNVSSVTSVGQRATTAPTLPYRFCQKCGRNGPGRMPRKPIVAPWTCPGCLTDKSEKVFISKKKIKHSKRRRQLESNQTPSANDRSVDVNGENEDNEEEDEEDEDEGEEDNKQQQDFAGFSETELNGHDNANDPLEDDRLSLPVKCELDDESDDGRINTSGQEIDDLSGEEQTGNGSSKDIRYWTCNDVFQYFGQHCKAWGELFQEQEIDGPSLLLMRKGDVLSRFGLKLGPAMELYQRIVALQNGDKDVVDVRLTWI